MTELAKLYGESLYDLAAEETLEVRILEELDGVAPCKIVKVDVDENRALALQYAVASIPTLLVFRNGQLVNRSVGLISREDVLKLVQA